MKIAVTDACIFIDIIELGLSVIISEHRHPIFRLKIRSVFRSITTQNMVRMA